MIENILLALANVRIKNILTGTILGSSLVAAMCIGGLV
ncbi:hypothetical protein EDC39_11229 [Geothermobacter ehrlichii]|uniref:Uncharacterized protein n=1 Tax=Geothermobacter ehrlichii TaxID=213224 RepID=A0A5D3WIF7_9BACT|nr:hypothetical protein EDC39_11229 [Geothermobacter ehrlichii]